VALILLTQPYENKRRSPQAAPYLVLSKLVNSQTAISELLGSGFL